MINRFCLVLALLLSNLSLHAASLVDEGFADFRARGAEAAFNTWSRHSSNPALLQSQAKFQELVNQEKNLGACLGHDIRFQAALGGNSQLYLVSSRFDKGALFFRMVVFTDSLNKSSLSLLRWSVDPAEVWPERVLYSDKR